MTAVEDRSVVMGLPGGGFSLQGQSVVITGASGALGSACALALAGAGAAVTLAGANESGLEQVRSAVLAAVPDAPPPTVVLRRAATPTDAEAVLAAAVAAHGQVTGMVVSSGLNRVAPVEAMEPDVFDEVMGANVRGSWLLAQAFGRQLAAQAEAGGSGQGSMVLVGSTRGKLGHPAGYSAYCTSKAAVEGLTRTLAAEWGARGVRANAVAPTVFRSELTAWMYAEEGPGAAVRAAMLSRIPLGRLAEAEDVTGAVVYFLSDAGRFCTGQVLYLDGGYTSC